MSFRSPVVVLGLSILVAAICFRLGFWQIRRLETRRAANAAALSARALPEIVLDSSAPSVPMANRRIRVTGRYDLARQLVLRGYLMGGTPGVHIVTPLRPASGDSAILVLRGFVPSPDATTINPDSAAEPDSVEVRGIGEAIPAEGGAGRVERGGQVTWKRLDISAVRAAIPYPVRDTYLLEIRDAGRNASPTGLPIRIEVPELDDGPHLSYAIQWFAFGTIGLIGGTTIARKQRNGSDPAAPRADS